jgi:signal transduction histidine kinase
VAEAVIRAGYPAAGAAGGIVVSLDAAETHFDIIGAEGYPPEAIAPWQRFPINLAMPLADAARAREPLLIGSAEEVAARYPNLPVLRTSRAVGAMAALPLVAEDRLVGAMSLRFVGSRTFGPDDRAFLRALADQCAVALDRARLFSLAQEQRARAEQTAREREAALADAQAAVQARDQFLSISAHELLTPVTTLRARSQFALRQLAKQGTLDPERTAQALRTIDWAASRLTLLVRQLLDVSRLRSGRMTLDRRPADLVRLVRDVASAAQSTTERHTFAVHAPATAEAEIDPLRIEQVLNNLLTNAIKYSPDGGPITIEVGVGGGAVRIAVEDRGVGIAPEHRPHLFEPYFQAHAASHQSGMGLGLYIAKEIVDLHGGTIVAEFPEHGGSRFVVTLPLGSVPNT